MQCIELTSTSSVLVLFARRPYLFVILWCLATVHHAIPIHTLHEKPSSKYLRVPSAEACFSCSNQQLLSIFSFRFSSMAATSEVGSQGPPSYACTSTSTIEGRNHFRCLDLLLSGLSLVLLDNQILMIQCKGPSVGKMIPLLYPRRCRGLKSATNPPREVDL